LAERRVLHPTLSAVERRRLFREGIERFNRGEFFASHESWEEIWRSTDPEPRDLFQGLIQVAAGLHLFLNLQRPAPARQTLAKGRLRLEPYGPAASGLDLDTLLAAVRRWEAWLAAGATAAAPPAPAIRVLDPAAVA
jgi:uncharacterized protein